MSRPSRRTSTAPHKCHRSARGATRYSSSFATKAVVRGTYVPSRIGSKLLT